MRPVIATLLGTAKRNVARRLKTAIKRGNERLEATAPFTRPNRWATRTFVHALRLAKGVKRRSKLSGAYLAEFERALAPQDDDRIWLGKAIPAPWRSGYAAACKAVYTGSTPVGASLS